MFVAANMMMDIKSSTIPQTFISEDDARYDAIKVDMVPINYLRRCFTNVRYVAMPATIIAIKPIFSATIGSIPAIRPIHSTSDLAVIATRMSRIGRV